MTFNREVAPKLKSDLNAGRSVLIFGPRQTGKTTLIQTVCAGFDHHLEYFVQLPSVRAKLEMDPEVLIRETDAAGERPLIFIDEIQKIPVIMDVLQYLLDEKRITLVASGSSTRKLRTSHANWLPGRIRLERMYPLTWRESVLVAGKSFDTKHFYGRLLFGGLPGILSEKNKEDRIDLLTSYTALYLEEEIRQEAVLRRLQPFRQFLQLAAMESGTIPNASKIAGLVGVSHTTVREYYRILEDSLIIHPIKSYGKSRSDVLRKPKYYFFDVGVRNAAAGIGHDPGILKFQMGTLFEHHVILELLARGHSLSYWRTKSGQEVDVIVELAGRKVLALEIKSTSNPKATDFSGLAAFKTSEKCDGAYLVCQVDRAQKFEWGVALPWWQLSSILWEMKR